MYHSSFEKSFSNLQLPHVVFFVDVARSRELEEGQVSRVTRSGSTQQNRVNDSNLFAGQ